VSFGVREILSNKREKVADNFCVGFVETTDLLP